MTDVRPRRIALPLESDGPGGAETMLIQFAEELRRRGHHVMPVNPAAGCGWLGGEFRRRGFTPATFELHRALDPGTVRGLVRLFRSERIDLVHSHEFTMAVYGALAARWLGIPHVITMHGSQSMLKAARHGSVAATSRPRRRWSNAANEFAVGKEKIGLACVS